MKSYKEILSDCLKEEISPVRNIRGKLNKQIQAFKGVEVFQKIEGKKGSVWIISFDENEGISTDADDWKEEITLYLFEYSPKELTAEIEVTRTGTDKRGRSDSELLGKKKFEFKIDDDITKTINYIKNQAKKHFKVKL